MKNNNIISLKDVSKIEIELLMMQAEERKQGLSRGFFGKKLASLFFESSTRTRISTETAAENLGMYVNGFSSSEGTSVIKGEPLRDTLKMFEGYGYDILAMRHSLEGAAQYASDILSIPVINAGDGSNGHPTQALLDLFTMKEVKGRIHGLKVALVGDLRYGRTVHSLMDAFTYFEIEPWLVAPSTVAMPEWRINDYRKATGKDVVVTDNLLEALKEVDILYMTRIQRERFPEGLDGEIEYRKVSGIYKVDAQLITESRNEDLKIFHPLPRYKENLEVGLNIDLLKQACYYQEAKNGVFLREALLYHMLTYGFKGRTLEVDTTPLWKDLTLSCKPSSGNDIYRLDNGTLIDHIESGKGKEVEQVLGLLAYKDTPVILARNVGSSRYQGKDILGIHDRELSNQELSKLALVSSNATVNIIKNKRVYRKGKVALPQVLDDLIQCQNLKCVTYPEHYEHVSSKFYVESRDPLFVRCHYCDTPTGRSDLILKQNL